MTLKANDLKVGDTHAEEVCRNLSRTQIVQYAGASGDYNPLHSDEIFTTQIAGYPSVFAHGMLTMGMTGKMLRRTTWATAVSSLSVSAFTAQVFPGATLTSKATVTDIKEEDGEKVVYLDVSTVDEEGTEVVKGTRQRSRLSPIGVRQTTAFPATGTVLPLQG
ncbi:MAG: MaoC/PaaZ C-terminal domain-containing protein [Gammaproteobacteria bacterium]|nr:MaoC/PaaZ C-terminal domain-containing protein [Gammaproteobacteria bacterium]